MYNQFTAIDQKPLPLGKVILNPMDIPKAGRKKKKKLHSKNPYKIKKIRLRGYYAMSYKLVDGLMLLKMLHFYHPKQVITANISYRRIIGINPDHLYYFSNLTELNCSYNYIQLYQLRKLPAIYHINIAHNQIKHIQLNEGGFNTLKHLELSFNYLHWGDISQLALLPMLGKLDISHNELQELPESLEHFKQLKYINLAGNLFRSDHKASHFWSSLATLPIIEHISIARNQIRGIHTEKLAAGNFSTLVILDFSYNIVENQHNLICARNFVSLKKLYITGNPFAVANQFKGLEMEVFARTGAYVIVENTNPYYLKPKKVYKPSIRFEKFIKVYPHTFLKKKDTLFGIELPKEEDLFSDDSEEQEKESVEYSDNEEPMFVTEQVSRSKKDKAKNSISYIVQMKQYEYKSEVGEEYAHPSASASLRSSALSKKSIKYDEFHKLAAEMLGNDNPTTKHFDIHTSYKALRKAVDRATIDP